MTNHSVNDAFGCPQHDGPGARRARAAAAESAARSALDEIPGLTWHPFRREDLPAIADFYATVETFDENPEKTSLADLEDFWDSPRSVPQEDTLVAFDTDARVAATA